ncbi:20122_t:CDS:1, partial [Gigaspora rosea]
ENNEDNKVYALHVNYAARNSLVIVVHLVQSNEKAGSISKSFKKVLKKKSSCSIKLGWIIVGLPTSFDFDLITFPAILKSINCPTSRLNDQYIANIPEHQYCILGTCVLKATEAKYPSKTKIVVGSHFTGKESACLFVYDLENREKPVNDESISQELTLNF